MKDQLVLKKHGNPNAARILLAEDSPIIQEMLRRHLESVGHALTVVEDGEQAVAVCQENAFDLILLDVQMPRLDGPGAARLIRSGPSPCAGAIILGITASLDAVTRQTCLAAGMNEVIAKPYFRAPLLATLARWLAPAKAAAQEATNSEPAGNSRDEPRSAKPVPFDYDLAVSEFCGDADLVAELAAQFVSQLAGDIEALRAALGSGDLDLLRRQAHRMAGGAAGIRAMPLADAARRLEQLARPGAREEVEGALQLLQLEAERLRDYVGGAGALSPGEQS